jgi:hypothetical protein
LTILFYFILFYFLLLKICVGAIVKIVLVKSVAAAAAVVELEESVNVQRNPRPNLLCSFFYACRI